MPDADGVRDRSALLDRALGAYLGLAIGDALGATVEFMTPREIAAAYGTHRRIVGGGWLRLAPGQVTDDTTMSLALGNAILAARGWELRQVAEAFAAWLRGRPVDCGNTCRRGIRRYLIEGSLSAPPNEGDAGNGALMRNLPVVLSTLGDDEALERRTLEQCRITHNHRYSDAATLALGHMTAALIRGRPWQEVEAIALALVADYPAFTFEGYAGRATAYVVDTVRTVLRQFFDAQGPEACIVATVNRGDDADTTGALAGMLCGARWGLAALPRAWLQRLDPAIRAAIAHQTPALLALSPMSSP